MDGSLALGHSMAGNVGGDGLTAVVAVLRNASCQERPDLIKPAEEQLQQWQRQPGFYHTLLQVYLDRALETNVRWMAVLCFKNGIEKFWRAIGDQKMGDEEKERIRSCLVTMCGEAEPLPQLSLQLAVCTGKIARQDCPTQWPELLPTLLHIVTENRGDTESALLIRQRALLTLHHVVKQISGKRLMHDRRKFQDLASKLFPEIYNLFKREVELFMSFNQAGAPLIAISTSLHRAHYCLKILRIMGMQGFKTPTEVQPVAEFYASLCPQIKVSLLFRKQHEGDAIKAPAEKFTNLLAKSLSGLLEMFPFCFLKYMRGVLEMTTTYAFTDEAGNLMYERFTVQCLNLIKCILDCPEFHVNKFPEENKSKEAIEAQKIKSEIFSKAVLEQICHRLITKYFILSRDDLEIWESDPEGFCTEVEGGDSWKFSLRPATEFLFRKMYHEFRDAFKPVLLSLMSEAIKMTDPTNMQGILSKDAVYNAFGLASFELLDEVDFDNWFTNHLVHELKITDSNYRILRRRVIWLVGRWTDVRFSADNRPLLYEACIHLLTHDPDFVVRYHTAITLKTAIDDFDFDCKKFLPYLATIFSLLFNLLKEAKECDVKMQVLNVMSIMIEVVGSEVRESAGPLVQFLPQLWQESAQHNLLRCAILTTLTHLVNGMARDSASLHHFLIEVLHVSTDTSQDSHVYLLEDGLQLWLSVLDNTPSLGDGSAATEAASLANKPLPPMYERLVALYANILPLMDTSTENLQLAAQITIAYTMLCPRHFLQKYGRQLVDILGGQVSDLKSEAQILVMRVMEMIVRTCHVDGVHLVRPAVVILMHSLVQEQEAQYPTQVSAHLSLLSRIILADSDSFFWIVEKVSERWTDMSESVLTCVLRVWCSRMCVVTPDERRKLAALALCRIIAINLPGVLQVWTRAVEAIVEVIYDVTCEDTNQDKLVVSESDYGSIDPAAGSSNEGPPSRRLQYDDAPNGGSSYRDDENYFDGSQFEADCEHNKRRQELMRRDPVHTIALRQYLGTALMQFQQHAPQETLQQLMKNMSPDTTNMVQDITSKM